MHVHIEKYHRRPSLLGLEPTLSHVSIVLLDRIYACVHKHGMHNILVVTGVGRCAHCGSVHHNYSIASVGYGLTDNRTFVKIGDCLNFLKMGALARTVIC